MTTTTHPVKPVPGDVVRVTRNGRTTLLEVEAVVEGSILGRLPYATTYVPGGAYEGSYRGLAARFVDEVVEVVRRAEVDAPRGMR